MRCERIRDWQKFHRKHQNKIKMSNSSKNILVAGGTGYIGTHTVLTLIEGGYDVTVVDNLVNSTEEGLNRVRTLTGCEESRIRFFNIDICNREELEKVFKCSPKFDSCIHFAGLKAVGESVQKPLLYYENNIGGTVVLVDLLDKYGCRSLIFSSSATVSTSTTYCNDCNIVYHISYIYVV